MVIPKVKNRSGEIFFTYMPWNGYMVFLNQVYPIFSNEGVNVFSNFALVSFIITYFFWSNICWRIF